MRTPVVPAAMSPVELQMSMSPPRRVKMRAWPISTLSSVKMEIAPPASVTMPGGVLEIAWHEGLVHMTGPVATSFEGVVTL